MDTDLSAIAKKRERQGIRKNGDLISQIFVLEAPLNDAYSIRCPSAHDHANRRDLVRIFNEIARDIYDKSEDCPTIKEFGSFVMEMFDAQSDLDLSINFISKRGGSKRALKVKALEKFANKLYALQEAGHVRNVEPVFSARVPILKVTDCGTGIECDLSVKNKDGIDKSHIILIVSAIDERFRKLCFLMKAWAKAHDINSSKDGTLNSLSLILLAAFHLQTRQPPIFPPFSAIFKDGKDPVTVQKAVLQFQNYGKENEESTAELFVSLLIALESVETLWSKGICASTFEGSWIYKLWKPPEGDNMGCISIEDFTARSKNTARAVRYGNMDKIYSSIRSSLQDMRVFIKGGIYAFELKNRLFGPVPVLQNQGTININNQSLHYPNLEDHTQRKRKNHIEEDSNYNLNNLSKKPYESSSFSGGTQNLPFLYNYSSQILNMRSIPPILTIHHMSLFLTINHIHNILKICPMFLSHTIHHITPNNEAISCCNILFWS